MLPKVSITTSPYYSLDGAISLRCDYAGEQQGTMRWLHGKIALITGAGVVITAGTFENNAQTFQLALSDVNHGDHAGDYSCELTLPDAVVITEITKVVVRRASVVSEAAPLVIADKNKLKIDCMVEADMAPSGVKWSNGDTQIVFDGATKFENQAMKHVGAVTKYYSNITLTSFTFVDEGNYKCLFNFADNKDAETVVSVVYATVHSEDCVFVDYRTDSTETLVCTLTGGAAATKVTFTDSLGDVQDGVLASFTAGPDSSTPGTQVGSFTTGTISEATQFSSKGTFTLADGGTVEAKIRVTTRS